MPTKFLEPKDLADAWGVSLNTAKRMVKRSSKRIKPARRRGFVPQFTAAQAVAVFDLYQKFLSQGVRRAVARRRATMANH